MTREHKLSLLLAFAVILVVGVLISDHLSGASQLEFDPGDPSAELDATIAFDDSRSDLVLLGPDGKPLNQPEEQALDAGEQGMVFSSSAVTESQSGVEWLGDQIMDAVLGLNTPPSAAQTVDDEASIPTIEMGRAYREQLRAQEEPDLASLPEFTLHRVRSGDSLWSLAQRYLGDGGRHPEIAAINTDRLGRGGVLRVGATIRIPPRSREQALRAAPAPTRADRIEQSADGESRVYVVKKGDTLSEIAQETLGTIRRMQEILEANAGTLESADDLRVGMKLTIPPR